MKQQHPPQTLERWFQPGMRRAGGVARPLVRLLGGAVALVLAGSCLLFVDETEFVVVETLGRITAVYDQADGAQSDRGLHFKWPWPVAIVRRFDRRQQLFEPEGREVFTRDKKNLTVSAYVCWRIGAPEAAETVAPPRAAAGDGSPGAMPDVAAAEVDSHPVIRFFRSVGDIPTAEARLEARLRAALAAEIGRRDLGELLAASDSEAAPGEASPLSDVARRVLEEVRQRADEPVAMTERLGIDLVDLRIRRINLPEGNRFAVYERMRSERERIAEQYRAAGQAERLRIESQGRRQADELLARAAAEAERIRGEGEAEALKTLNAAHAEDPEFYEFQRTLTAYSKMFGERTQLVLSTGSKLLRLLSGGVPPAAEPTQPTTATP